MSYRNERLNAEMRKVIAEIIENKIKDPRKTEMVSVVCVTVAKDLKTAKVVLSIYGDEDKKQTTFDAVVKASGFIRKELSIAFRDIRVVPSLEFKLDASSDYSAKIESLLQEIKRK